MADDRANPALYTIGHSNHDWPSFLCLLQRHQIALVADVRSHPTSRFAHFRRRPIESLLADSGIEYLFLGRELGARRDEPECYLDGRVDYERVAGLPLFRAGIERVQREFRQRRVALMCAEKEPLDCHRTVLVCRQLQGWPIRHILAGGELEPHSETEQRLIQLTGVGPTLLEPKLDDAEMLFRAYQSRGREIAHRLPVDDSDQAAAR